MKEIGKVDLPISYHDSYDVLYALDDYEIGMGHFIADKIWDYLARRIWVI